MAVLAITPRTHAIRVAIWPIVTLLALRAVVSVNVSVGKSRPEVFDTALMVRISRTNLFRCPHENTLTLAAASPT
ncbi:hypothetical protein JVU11DRAFT_11906 [Chiua virens]|nr:hypothetical protein JVU11DRAFT_11906 [Chiua virens]